ncbi:hypothetical protein [Streptomyces mangrovi]|uniref:hypothetical protein n=1 Tax=Streptomyces mangrovi TaxID=1206892 RepID=UPI00399C5203
MPRWTSRIRWTDDRATHDGRAYLLWSHGYSTGKDGPSRHDAWHLHATLPGGNDDPRPLIHLGTNKRRAQRMAELYILGWRRAVGYRAPDGREQWRSPTGELHPLNDLLTGTTTH